LKIDQTELKIFTILSDGGYDIADFYNIDPRYGENSDLEELFTKAKELGIRILLDLVS
jgi:glycosidase